MTKVFSCDICSKPAVWTGFEGRSRFCEVHQPDVFTPKPRKRKTRRRVPKQTPAVTTLSVQVVTGAGWYEYLRGEKYEVVNHGRKFNLVGCEHISIDKDHAVITAVNYPGDKYATL